MKIGPYETGRVYVGDCLALMRDLPDGSVPMIWTDPPYGHANHDGDFNARLNEHRGIDGQPIANDTPDEMRRVVDGMLVEAARVLDPNDCCCCCCCGGGGGPRPTFAWVADRMDRGGLSFFHSVIWDKINPGLGWRFRRQHEMVMVAHRSGSRLRWNEAEAPVPNVVRASAVRERNHPNEKPTDLVRRFISVHTKPGDLVLDPFAGSGSTGVAAIQLGREFLGFELDQKWADVANERLEAARRGQTLASYRSGQEVLFPAEAK